MRSSSRCVMVTEGKSTRRIYHTRLLFAFWWLLARRSGAGRRLFEVKNLFQPLKTLIRTPAPQVLKKGRHVALPTLIHFAFRHPFERALIIGRLKVADQ